MNGRPPQLLSLPSVGAALRRPNTSLHRHLVSISLNHSLIPEMRLLLMHLPNAMHSNNKVQVEKVALHASSVLTGKNRLLL